MSFEILSQKSLSFINPLESMSYPDILSFVADTINYHKVVRIISRLQEDFYRKGSNIKSFSEVLDFFINNIMEKDFPTDPTINYLLLLSTDSSPSLISKVKRAYVGLIEFHEDSVY